MVIAKISWQRAFDDFKEHKIGFDNFLDIFLIIKYLHFDPGLRRFLPEQFPELK